jgi:hypothetical protein
MRPHPLVCLALLVLLIAARGAAQPPANARLVRLLLGDSVPTMVSQGARVRLPVQVEVTPSGGAGLAAVQLVARWDTAQLHFDSLRTAHGAPMTVTANPTTGSGGFVRFNAFGVTAVSRTSDLVDLHFTVRLPAGAAYVTLGIEAAGDEGGADIAAAVVARGATVCVGPCGAPAPPSPADLARRTDRELSGFRHRALYANPFTSSRRPRHRPLPGSHAGVTG